ncbi:hypothetical protein OG206_02160 [Streptomyces sp. NBC_01341]|uniref:hypothetical protein n=1 Tax=Streptomyces sp. NBC_01341 TaxID=2903831 RepID=UPI002E13E831|nr:hypothetical protein OG206_02160 [Streptomyces sp. NBC_01341]
MGIRGATAGDVQGEGAEDTGDGRPAVHHRSADAAQTLRRSVESAECAAAAVPGDGVSAPDAVRSGRPVFVDATGRRSRTWRLAGTATALYCACYATTVGIALIGGDSSAPFLQLPRAMGLERGGGEKPAASEDEGRAAPAGDPVPRASTPAARDRAHPSAAGRSADPLRVEASSDPADIRVADARPAVPPAGPRDSAMPSDGGAQDGTGGTEPASNSPSPAPGTGGQSGPGVPPADGGGGTPDPEDDGDASASGGPIGDLLGGLLGGLLGRG